MRLNQFLARAGLGSRRGCEEIILAGDVSINGTRTISLSTQVSAADEIRYRGRLLVVERDLSVAFHKPKGILCSTVSQSDARTIFDLLPSNWPRVFYVGRLDKDSEGLLILTNNGALAQRLAHPSYKLPKTYEVTLNKPFDFEKTEKLLKGFIIEGKRAKASSVHRLGPRDVRMVLTQGIKRQIREMFYFIGYDVKKLVRTQIGGLKLGRLKSGEWRELKRSDLRLLAQP